MFKQKETIRAKIPQPAWLYRDKEHFEKLVKRKGFCQFTERYRMMLN